MLQAETIIKQVQLDLFEGYSLWEGFPLPSLNKFEKEEIPKTAFRCYSGEFARDFASACQSFYLFRKLHEDIDTNTDIKTLLGDFFFSRFSNHLIPIDNTKLINAFAEYLKRDSQREVEGKKKFSINEYKLFIEEASRLITRL